MKNTYKRLILIILSIIISLSFISCSVEINNPTETEIPSASPTAEPTAEPSKGYTISGKYADINPNETVTYEDYDMSIFEKKVEACEKLISEKKEKEAFTAYKDVENEVVLVEDYKTLTRLLSYEDTTNEIVAGKLSTTSGKLESMRIGLSEIGHKMSVTFGENFKKELNDDWLYDYYLNYEEVSSEVKALFERESELTSDYARISSEFNTDVVTFEGKEYSYSSFSNDSSLFNTLGEEKYYELYELIWKKYNDKAGAVFLDLVKVRDQIAKLYGFENYALYADAKDYYRDYTEEDLEKYYTAIKTVSKNYKSTAYNLRYYLGYVDSLNELTHLTEQLLPYMSEYCKDTFYQLINDGLLLGTKNQNSYKGANSNGMYAKKNGTYIYIGEVSSYYDILGLTHELGHATNSTRNRVSPLDRCSIDLAEIHSTGNEILLSTQYSSVFTESTANLLEAIELDFVLGITIQGCIYDEWQREVYHNPDMTLEEINDAFERISLEYGITNYSALKYTWIDVPHNFNSPMYYMCYSTSNIVAMQLYVISLTDREKAIGLWEKIVDKGINASYMEVVSEVGLVPFTNGDYVVEIFTTIQNRLTEVLDKIYG